MKMQNFKKFLKISFLFLLYIFSKILLNSNHEITNIKSNAEINTTENFNIKINKIIKDTDV